jgi:thiol:disulfide interchange protein DsbA
MDCRDVDRILDGHDLRGLSAAKRAEFDEHAEGCRRCAAAVLSHELLAGEPPVRSRPELYAATLAAVAASPGSGLAAHPARRFGPGSALAAAALLGLVAAGLMGRAGQNPDPPPDAGAVTIASTAAENAPAATAVGDTPKLEARIPGYLAGIHYQRLTRPAPTTAPAGKVEVCVFFLFPCEHCFDFEPALEAFSDARSDTVELVHVPALFGPGARLQAQAFYTAEALGRGEELIGTIYAEIHDHGNPLATVEALRELFSRHGIDPQHFDAAFDSDAVRARMDRAGELNRLYGIDAAPSIGVNGRYLTNSAMTGSDEATLELVGVLVDREAQDAACDVGESDACRLRSPPTLPRPAAIFQ